MSGIFPADTAALSASVHAFGSELTSGVDCGYCEYQAMTWRNLFFWSDRVIKLIPREACVPGEEHKRRTGMISLHVGNEERARGY